VAKVKEGFTLERVVFVGDRGLISGPIGRTTASGTNRFSSPGRLA
jgi:hypothetical protein